MKKVQPFTLFRLALMGMELSYLYLLASLLGGSVYILILALLLYPLALLSNFALNRSVVSHQLRFKIGLSLVILIILAVAGERLIVSLAAGQADVLGIVLRLGFCGLTWLLGYTVPQERVNYTTIAFRLQVGILAVLIFAQVAGSAPPAFLFFLLAPPALFLARWASSASRGAIVLRPPNLNHLLLATASTIVPGTALILILSPGVAHAIVGWLKDIFTKFSAWWEARQAAATQPSKFNFDFSCNMRPEQAAAPTTPMPTIPSEGATGISPVVMWILAFVLFLVIVTLVALALRRRKAGRKARLIEPVRFQLRMVSLDMLRNLKSLLPRLLKKLWLWLISIPERCKKRPRTAEEPLISIRALYRNLLRWAARQGVSHLPSQTPLEHLVLLEQRFPQQQDDLKQVIEAYLLARYSQQPVSQEEFDRVKKAWHRTVTCYT